MKRNKNTETSYKNKKHSPLAHVPYLLLSLFCGAVVGALIFVFKITASAVISLSGEVYSFVRGEPAYLPLLVAGAAFLGLAASFILRYAPDGRGGGIPTAISVLRGLITFSWVKSLFSMFTSAMLTYLCAVPLGNEGPSVQMGTAVGRGCVRIFGKNHEAWDRYIMTGGACAGFAAATGAPLTGVFFAFEEAHRRFSPMIFTVSAITAVSSSAVMKLLCDITGTSYSIFGFELTQTMPLQYIWVAFAVGVVCGVCAMLFSKAYKAVRELLNGKLAKLPFWAKMTLVFAIVSLLGFFSADFVGSGHSLVDELIEGHGIWYLLMLFFLVRALLLLFANNIGVTGGLFVPTLAFGAIIGALIAKPLVAVHILPEQYYGIVVIIGITAILASLSRTPIMAIAFSLEALGAVSNILPVILGVTVAHLVVEGFEIAPFTDVVIEGKLEDAHKGREPIVVDTRLTVAEGAFVIDKEIRDILWPPSCVILSVHKNPDIKVRDGASIYAGDELDVHYRSYDPAETERVLESYVGKQSEDHLTDIHRGDENDSVPEL